MQEKKEENEEINYEKIISQGRDLINENGQYRKGEYYINLALLSHNIIESSKINCIGIKSFLNLKLNNEHYIIIIVKKYFNYIKEKRLKSFSSDTITSIVKGFYRGGLILNDNKKHFLAAFCLYKAKQILIEQKQNVDESIETRIKQVMSEITSTLNDHKEIYKQNLELIREIKRDIDSIEEPEITIGETYYVISALWMNNLREFFKNESNRIDKLFDKISVFSLYSSNENDDEYQNNLGKYPGPINNFFIMNFKESWIDPDPLSSYTNIYLKDDIKEKSDFFLINEALRNKLKQIFNCYYEIPRKVVTMFHEKMIDVRLKKFKVLILCDALRDENLRYLMFPKYLQISKLESIQDFKLKIIRILNNLTNLNRNWEMKIFIPEYANQQKQIFDIVYQYSNKFSNSYKIKYEEITEDELILDNSKIVPKDILIVELKDISQKAFFIQQFDEEKLQCYICEEIIKNESVIMCDFCQQYFYCSMECKRVDKYHTEYHRNLNILLKKTIDLNELIQLKMSKIIDKHSKGGLTGLKNLGNTCFMNSALQCLSHTEELTKYFLLSKYVDEINKKNKLGTCGKMAESWYELLKNLWQGNSNYLNPSDFRSIFVKFAHQFAGYSQHDSHEMLAFMLDALHEDLNRVKDKPYIEMQECQASETETEASTKWWKNHIRRENSIIVDLFHGQYKSKITCPGCSRISITYDPFMYLGIPIPSGQRLKFKFFSRENQYNYIELILKVNDFMKIAEIKQKIYDLKKSSTFDNYEKLEAILVKEKVFRKIIKDEENFTNYYENDYEVLFYEKEFIGPDYLTFYISPVDPVDSERRFFINRSILYYVKPFEFHKSSTVRDLYYKVFIFYRKIIEDIDINRTGQIFLQNMTDELYLNQEFELYLNKVKSIDEFCIKFNIFYNIPDTLSIMSNSKVVCEYCGERCIFCCLKHDFTFSLQKLHEIQKYKRPFLLICQINKKKSLSPEHEIYSNDISSKNKNKDSINIYDCLEAFSLEEKLEKENAWYCNKCQKHQLALKKLEIYKSPYILIIQIKRFKMRTNYAALSSLVNRKNDSLIDFPRENFDLSPYVVGPEKSKAKYDLFAVSQHYGSMSGGHYTAVCRNENSWFKFDDESVYKETEVVTNSAYLLFYKRHYI